jgi:hypothetical protein
MASSEVNYNIQSWNERQSHSDYHNTLLIKLVFSSHRHRWPWSRLLFSLGLWYFEGQTKHWPNDEKGQSGKQRSTKHESNTKTQSQLRWYLRGKQFLLHQRHLSCYSSHKPVDQSWMRKYISRTLWHYLQLQHLGSLMVSTYGSFDIIHDVIAWLLGVTHGINE